MHILGTWLTLLLTSLPVPSGDLDAFVREQSERAGAPGVAYAVVGPGGTEHEAAFGEDGDGAAVTAGTAFVWGSVSKPVTATLAVLLADAGELDLDAEVGEVLPEFQTSEVTVRELLDHTSGLPEGLELTDRYDDDRSISALIPEIAALDRGEVGTHAYSSLNYIVLAAVIEEVTGSPYAEVLRERLLGPAGMSTTYAEADAAEEVLPPGHRYVLGSARAFDTQVDPATVPAGYLTGSVADLAAFARTQLVGGTVLDDEQRDVLHTAEVETGGGGGYALGWRTGRVPGTDEPMVWHGGAAPGYSSAIVLLPERDLAVVVLENAYGPFQETALLDTAFGVAALLAGGEPEGASADPAYPIALVALGLLVLALLAALVVSVRSRPSTGRVIASLVVLAVVGAGLLALPRLAGVTLGQLGLWAPDLSWLVHAALVLVALVALVRVGVRLRTRASVG